MTLLVISSILGETIHRLRVIIGEFYALALEQFRRLLAREKILVFERALPARVIEAKVRVVVRIAQSSDISELAWKFGARATREGIRKGHLCFIADMNGEIVHYKWVAFDDGVYVSELNRNLHLAPKCAYIYSSYTVRKYRGLRLDPKVTTKAFEYLHERGIERVYILVRRSNRPSLRAVKKVGYRTMGEIRFLQVLGFRKYACEGVTEKDRHRIREMFFLQ